MLNFVTRLTLCFCLCLVFLRAESPDEDDAHEAGRAGRAAKIEGVVTGTAIDQANQPVEFVAVTLKKPDGAVVQSVVTDSHGRFMVEKVPAGEYTLAYAPVGADNQITPPFRLDAQHPQRDFNQLKVSGDVLKLEKFEVREKQQAQMNAIDRKVYNVGKEIQSTSGSASDLLQNVPSVQVDIDGNVSLRGSDNVLILINGRSSTLMGRSRAEILQQLPADEIEKIEVITNPSAKYKPDGTAGIINIALKRKHTGGFSGTVNVSAGIDDRYSGGVSANYHQGPYNVFGSASLRQDDRLRQARDVRTIVDPVTGTVTQADKKTSEHSRPLTRLVRAGIDYAPDEHNQLGFTGNFNRRTFDRRATDQNISTNASGAITSDYDRLRFDPEYEQSLEFAGNWQHTFAEEGHELNLELRSSATDELEPNHYTNRYRTPAQPDSADNKIFRNTEHSSEAIVEYVRPLDDGAKFEAGYTRSADRLDADFLSQDLDLASGLFVTNAGQTNRFIFDGTIHAFYGTYARTFGRLGVLAGLRPELTYGKSRLVNTGAIIRNDYARVYPSLHLSYKLTDRHEFQLNYSHRVHRPESEDLNPFPEFIDPFNLRSGNPRLKPEDIHSIEAGYSFRQGATTLTSTLYHRYTYNAFTSITTDLGDAVLLTTRTNLGVSRATGLELTANTDVGKLLTLNFSSNTFFNTIDASNLGFSGTQSDVSWLAKTGATLHLPQNLLLQFNANYVSTRLTPQGSRGPSFYANLGLRRDIWNKKAAVVLTVSDVFNSLKETTVIDTPLLRENIDRRRSSRIVYLGFLYNFGSPPKKSKDDPLKFDNSL